jgi:hypothetical protein
MELEIIMLTVMRQTQKGSVFSLICRLCIKKNDSRRGTIWEEDLGGRRRDKRG